MSGFTKNGVYFLPLGGSDEIGMNMYVYAYNGKFIIVDAGYGFLQDEYPGMDMCYASPDFIEHFKDDILGLFITHGHEDHFGAIAHIWPSLTCPVYASNYSIGLMKERLKEYRLQDIVPLKSINLNKVVELGDFIVEFISVAHSVPETSALFIQTPEGNIMHATDWRFDDDKLSLLKTDYAALERAGNKGVDIFVCDSTNVRVNQEQPTEKQIRESLLEIIPSLEGGIVVTCFASNVMRLESIIQASFAAGRTPVLVGRSLETNMKIAKECGYLKEYGDIPSIRKTDGLTIDKAVYICTGAQANYRSAMTRIANDEHKEIKLSSEFNVIFSSKVIPGNEDKIELMQEKMISLGANLITEEDYLVHTSGHPNKEDLENMYKLLKPKIVFPVHGDKRFIREHKKFALSCGIKDVCSATDGDIFCYSDGKIKLIEQVSTDVIGVDRGRSVSLGSDLIKNRKRIAYNCSLFISAVVGHNYTLDFFQISSIDILEENEWFLLSNEIKKDVIPLIERRLAERRDVIGLEDFIRGQVRRRVLAATQIKPVTTLHFFFEESYIV